MPPEFTRDADGLWARLDKTESEVFRRLVAEMRTLLTSPSPTDELVKGRLFPNAYESAEDEQAFRELVGDDLEKAKLEAVELVARAIIDGKKIDTLIPESQIDAWLTVLTDMRLAIGTRLDVDEEKMSSEVDLDDPNAPAMAVLHWLGWMQETIIEEISTTTNN